MYLKRLEIQGFKSFADKTVLHFGDDITAIVGPNGSGKSNISDAISWVMGEMSSKALRGAKMEDVIFGGTQKRSQLGFAEATLVLDNSDGALSIETPEVMVTRRYYRSGESEYYINKQLARLRDINEMFMDTGLGKEGYSNIGQGRIDEILAVKSTDRREVFEEAAGISKYRHRKEETERRLASTEDNLMRIGDKISELELQVEPLREQAAKAEKYLQFREELKGLEVAVWLEKLQGLSDSAKKAQTDHSSIVFVLEQQNDELTRLYQLTEQLTMQLNHQSLVLDQKRENITVHEGALHQKENEIAVLQAGVENSRRNIDRIRQELTEQEDRSGGISEQIAQQEKRIEELTTALETLHEQIEKAQQEANDLAASSDTVEKQVLGIRAGQAMLQAESARKQAEIASLDASLEDIRQRRETVQTDLSAASGRRDEMAAQLRQFKKTLEEAQETVTSCTNSAAGYALRQKSRIEKRDTLQKEVDALRIDLQTAQSRSRMLQEMLRDHEGAPKAVRLVMQEAGRSLRNIHGLVSELIRTEDEYTVAIETALGAAMQNIVVSTEEDGKAAVQFLKRNDGGRATFLPISAIRGRDLQEKDLHTCSGFVGIASELVRYESTYAGIISNLLGRIVLVENLDHAIKMARKYQNRFKIVTLDGQVMNAGGSMTGGSASKNAGILSRANELTRWQEKERQLKEKLASKETELSEAVRSAAEVEFELTAIQGQLRQAEDEVLRAGGNVGQASALVAALDDNIHAYERELESLKNRTAGEDSRLTVLRADIAKAEAELEALQQQLDALTQGQDALSQETGLLADRITKLRMDEAAFEAERTTARENVRSLGELAADMEGDRGQKETLIATYEAEIARMQEQIALAEQGKLAVEQDIDAARLELQRAQQDRAELEARRVKTDKDAQEKNVQIRDLEREAARLEQKKNAAAMEEQQIIDKLWDSYELTPNTADSSAAQIESTAAANKRIAELKRKISALGTPNLGAIEEFARVNERYEYLTGQRDDVLHAKKELENIITTITGEMTEIFVREFNKINENLCRPSWRCSAAARVNWCWKTPMSPSLVVSRSRCSPPVSRSRPSPCSPAAKRRSWRSRCILRS